jgi:large subunit ribosomal protein L5
MSKSDTATATKPPTQTVPVYAARLKLLYRDEIRPRLVSELKLKNLHEVPALEKIVINVGYGRAKEDGRMKEAVRNTLAKVTGQQPVDTVARQSVAGFKLREGQIIGAKLTLRGERMYDFLDRLINIVLPRVRDFHGVSRKGFDGRGNYSLGLSDQSVFPELSYEETVALHGLEITIVIKDGSPEASHALLKAFGMPFVKEKES